MTETVELEVVVVDETDRAYAIANPEEDNEWRNLIWLPKSQVRLEEPYRGSPELQPVIVEMPRWLATEKGLI